MASSLVAHIVELPVWAHLADPLPISNQADMVAYGKTLGGGMPVGVVCGKRSLMQRFDPEHPLRVAYVIGTFAAAPSVLGPMAAFLEFVTSPTAAEKYERGAALTAK